MRASLVPAYAACSRGSANRTHGPPLAHPSCNPAGADPGAADGGHARRERPARELRAGPWCCTAIVGDPGTVPTRPTSRSGERHRRAAADVARRLHGRAGGAARHAADRQAERHLRHRLRDRAGLPMSFAVPCTATATATGCRLQCRHERRRACARQCRPGQARGVGARRRCGSSTAARTTRPPRSRATRCSPCRASSFPDNMGFNSRLGPR